MKVSILIPLYNAEAYIESTLKSCLEQEVHLISDIIVVDDHSTDDGAKVVREFAESHPCLNIKCFSNPSKGACAARNFALEKAGGDVVQWLDADDLLGKNKLSNQLELLRRHPNHLICCRWQRFVDRTRSSRYPEEPAVNLAVESSPLQWLKEGPMMAVHGWIGAKSLFQKAGSWDETLLINQDGEYMTRVIAESDGVIFDSQSKVWYRSNLSGSTSQYSKSKTASLFKTAQSFETVYLSLATQEDSMAPIANKYMEFLYRVYPNSPQLMRQANSKVERFGPPTMKQTVADSIVAKLIVAFFGWRFLVGLRTILRNK